MDDTRAMGTDDLNSVRFPLARPLLLGSLRQILIGAAGGLPASLGAPTRGNTGQQLLRIVLSEVDERAREAIRSGCLGLPGRWLAGFRGAVRWVSLLRNRERGDGSLLNNGRGDRRHDRADRVG